MLRNFSIRFFNEVAGSTVTEFALIASLIAVALGSSFLALGNEVEGRYDMVETRYRAVN